MSGVTTTAVRGGIGTNERALRHYEHAFFSGMSILIAAIVFVGFARTYFLRGVFHPRPLPSWIIHVHAAVFTCWVVLLVIQTSLVASHRVKIHRRLGILGFLLAPLVLLLGVVAATDTLTRSAAAPGFDPRSFYAIPLSEIAGFAVPALCALCMRRDSAVHKRLILIATIAMTTAAFGRWPVHLLLHKPLPAMLAAFSLFLVLALYDLVSNGKIHRATLAGSVYVIAIELLSFPVGHTAAWHAFASRMQSSGL
jgi:fumarate reductase subunit C